MRLALPRRLPKAVAVHRAARRSLHTPLPLSSLSFNVDAGLKPFLSPATTRMLAVEWQEGLLDRLNEYVAGQQHRSLGRDCRELKVLPLTGTESEGKTLFDTIVDLSKDRTQVVPFNLASEALNNSFFLNCLVSSSLFDQCPAAADRCSLSSKRRLDSDRHLRRARGCLRTSSRPTARSPNSYPTSPPLPWACSPRYALSITCFGKPMLTLDGRRATSG